MKKIKISLAIFLVVILLSACGNYMEIKEVTEESKLPEKEIIVMDSFTSYVGYNSYQEALQGAETVVYGTVKEIGEPFSLNFGDEKTIIKAYYTPITIEVIECIKGDVNGTTIVYNAKGAEFDDVIYDYQAYDTLEIEVGDKLLVYLSENNRSISPQCVIGEDENGIATRSTLDQRMPNYPLEKHVELARKAYARMTEKNR